MALRIAISAGEPSGDEHASRVASVLKLTHKCQIRGMGGRALRAVGAETVVDCEVSGSLMGFTEVLLSARDVLSSWKRMTALLVNWKPDILILVDYADFNLRLAKRAHELGIKTLYYITPQLWAWRSGRIDLFKKYIDRAAVIFPFERPFFAERGYDRAVFVGHPFADVLIQEEAAAARQSKTTFFNEFNLDSDRKTLAVFPGSRKSEITRLLPLTLSTAKLLSEEHPEVQIVLGAAPGVADLIRANRNVAKGHVRVIEGRSLDILRNVDAALLKSGTSNLQSAFLGTPCSMFFLVPWLSELIVKHFVGIKQFSIVNIVRPNTIREILQNEASPHNLAVEAADLLFNQARREGLLARMEEVKQMLNSFDSLPLFSDCRNEAERTAALVIDTIGA